MAKHIEVKKELVLEVSEREGVYDKVYQMMFGTFSSLGQEFDWYLAEQLANDIKKVTKPSLVQKYVMSKLKEYQVWDEEAYHEMWMQPSTDEVFTIGDAIDLGIIQFPFE